MKLAEKTEKRFENRVQNAIDKMKEEYKYNPTELRRMISEHGTVNAVKRLINNPNLSYGFKKLCMLKALHLSLEAIILENDWKELFTEEERKIAKRKLT